MSDMLADIRRVFDVDAAFVGERIKRGMFGFAVDTQKHIVRDESGVYHRIGNYNDAELRSLLNNKADSSALAAHANNDARHINAGEREAWNAIQGNVQADWGATSGLARILNKPTEFPAAAHQHIKADITDFSHIHTIADVTGLQGILNSKQGLLSAGANITIDPVTNEISATNTVYDDSALWTALGAETTARETAVGGLSALLTTLGGNITNLNTLTATHTTQISALMGTMVYLGTIDATTVQIRANNGLLTTRANALIAEHPGFGPLADGHTLIDANNVEWRRQAGGWVELGQFSVDLATNANAGLIIGGTQDFQVEFNTAGIGSVRGLATALSGKASASDLTAHTGNGDIHVTASLKSTWSGKQDAITGAATTITTSNLTASRVLVSDASGKVAVSGVASATLGYLDISQSLTALLNGKSNTGHTHARSEITDFAHQHSWADLTSGTQPAPPAHNQAYTTINNITSARLLGRYSAGAGAAELITIGTGLSLSAAGELTATAGTPPTGVNQRVTLGTSSATGNNSITSATLPVDGTLSVANGGTGATDVATARSNLGAAAAFSGLTTGSIAYASSATAISASGFAASRYIKTPAAAGAPSYVAATGATSIAADLGFATANQIPYASGAGTLSFVAAATTAATRVNILTALGTSAAPSWHSATPSNGQVLTANGAGGISWANPTGGLSDVSGGGNTQTYGRLTNASGAGASWERVVRASGDTMTGALSMLSTWSAQLSAGSLDLYQNSAATGSPIARFTQSTSSGTPVGRIELGNNTVLEGTAQGDGAALSQLKVSNIYVPSSASTIARTLITPGRVKNMGLSSAANSLILDTLGAMFCNGTSDTYNTNNAPNGSFLLQVESVAGTPTGKVLGFMVRQNNGWRWANWTGNWFE